jgi:hypothetical protein
MSFLRDLALAHQKHEGWFPGSVSQRNNNPGNLRLTPYQMSTFGAVMGERNFAKFPTYELGLQALMGDLRAKITGNSAHINYNANPTLLTYVSVYAPVGDGNAPVSYANAVIADMAKKGWSLKLDTSLAAMALLLNQEEAPMVYEEKPLPIATQIKQTVKAIARSSGQRLKMLERKLKRLLGRV